MITIPKTENYVWNEQRAIHDHTCIVCGRGIKDPTAVSWLTTFYGSEAITVSEYQVLNVVDPRANSGAHPIGNDCLRRHPELQPCVDLAGPWELPEAHREAWELVVKVAHHLSKGFPLEIDVAWRPATEVIELGQAVCLEAASIPVERFGHFQLAGDEDHPTATHVPNVEMRPGWMVYSKAAGHTDNLIPVDRFLTAWRAVEKAFELYHAGLVRGCLNTLAGDKLDMDLQPATPYAPESIEWVREAGQ